MPRLGLGIHEFLWARPFSGIKLVDPKSKPWGDEMEGAFAKN
jgi:hypothetical protein